MKKVEDERDMVRTVAGRWAEQYKDWLVTHEDKACKGKALAGLDPETATASDVARIVGNDTWVGPPECIECQARTYEMIHLGEVPGYDARFVRVCRKCLVIALSVLKILG